MKKTLLAAVLFAFTAGIAYAEIAARHGLDAAQYQQQFNQIVAQGFRPVHVDGYATPAGVRYAAIWLKSSSTRPWVARHGQTTAQFQAEFNDLTAKGFRLVDISATDGGNFAGIYEKGEGPEWYSFAGLNTAAFKTQFDQKTQAGFRATDIEGYVDGGQVEFAVIWVKNTDGRGWYLFNNMDAAAYQQKFNEMTAQGYRPVHVDGYGTPSGARFAAIFEKRPGAFVARHNMSAAAYQTEFNTQAAAGFTLTDVSGYTDGNEVKYAAIWEK
jgi:hypothetical protein